MLSIDSYFSNNNPEKHEETEEEKKIREFIYKDQPGADNRFLPPIVNKPIEEKEADMVFDEYYEMFPEFMPTDEIVVTRKEIDTTALVKSLKELENLIGLESVKAFIKEIVLMVKLNHERVKIGQFVKSQALHMIFIGNAGTGKTTVARLMGDILFALNVIPNNKFVEVSREDLVDNHIGGTAKKTMDVLEEAFGGVLFIDEVYSLYSGTQNDFGKEAIDTLVKFMEDNKENFVVIAAGYTQETMRFLSMNSGLKSRFPNIVQFPDYTPQELVAVAVNEIAANGFTFDDTLKPFLVEVMTKKQIPGRNDLGNGRLARNIVEQAIRKQGTRLSTMKVKTREDFIKLLPTDFGFEAEEKFDLEKELATIIGNDEIKDYLRRLQKETLIQQRRKELGMKVNEPARHMIFTGDPGTGKTTIARLVGKMLKELNIVKSGHVVEVTREDLVEGYIGQTAVKTKKKIHEALGGILFIDEVYSLNRGGENDFGKEAIDTLVKQMEEHYENLIVIIAGYEHETKQFLAANSGLPSRFPNTFVFKNYNDIELVKIAMVIAHSDGYTMDEDCVRAIYKRVQLSNKNGNGRFARNLVAEAKSNLMVRLSNEYDDISRLTKQQLQKLEATDFL